ncbi:MAG TPA: DUF1272 domain-containing protein [Haliangiales bacterium]|nr:DUF1272 domain-containing protein [Haliangiales bacterium]
MLELRPACENCGRRLPPSAADARICSFECTFCADCVDRVLENVCPNCGGGFCPRPVRPARELKPGQHLGAHPASTAIRHRPVDRAGHAAFAAEVRSIPPHER